MSLTHIPEDLWGILREIQAEIDRLNSREPLPIGTILSYAGPTAPAGFLLCDGTAVSRTTYAVLFGAIGVTFGSGDGSTTFNVPNTQDCFLFGAGTIATLGETGGEATHLLTTDEMPAHGHSVTIGRSSGWQHTGGFGDPLVNPGGESASVIYNSSSAGGSDAHNNMPPHIGINFIIAAL
jgi:microcystin-dependent protein